MSIDDNVLVVIVIEQIVPNIRIKLECIVEDKLEMRCLRLDHISHIFVELFENIHVRFIPRFINRLDRVES